MIWLYFAVRVALTQEIGYAPITHATDTQTQTKTHSDASCVVVISEKYSIC